MFDLLLFEGGIDAVLVEEIVRRRLKGAHRSFYEGLRGFTYLDRLDDLALVGFVSHLLDYCRAGAVLAFKVSKRNFAQWRSNFHRLLVVSSLCWVIVNLSCYAVLLHVN